ncbi:hypothetical protein JTB14_031460 [Gonioctena quinquepunctata]|nr:hypothetical protein JTB14_031460 [Gonioctena quinquepunctata]
MKEHKKTIATTIKKKGRAVKKKRVHEEETDEESLEGIEETSDNDYNLDDELADFSEENEFVTSLDKTPETIEKGDWILVKFATGKLSKFYIDSSKTMFRSKICQTIEIFINFIGQIPQMFQL